MNKDLLKYLSIAPILLSLWIAVTASFIIVTIRFYPDMLYFPL